MASATRFLRSYLLATVIEMFKSLSQGPLTFASELGSLFYLTLISSWITAKGLDSSVRSHGKGRPTIGTKAFHHYRRRAI
jgi:hypothetical protein